MIKSLEEKEWQKRRPTLLKRLSNIMPLLDTNIAIIEISKDFEDWEKDEAREAFPHVRLVEVEASGRYIHWNARSQGGLE